MLNGILLVDKPAGWTSHDVVAKVRSLLRQAQSQKLKAKSLEQENSAQDFRLSARGSKIRVGHTGTLDPFATGLLILVLGSYTKRAQEFSGMDKTYEAEMILGVTSTTGDPEGEVTGYSGQVTADRLEQVTSGKRQVTSHQPSKKQLEAVFAGFVGVQMQMPHKFSAKKVDGQKAYDLARAGKEVKLEPKQVEVYSLELIDYSYPTVKFTATVSSGTYIRSLAEDIGKELGTGAYLSALRRTTVGNYRVEDAKQIDKLSQSDIISL